MYLKKTFGITALALSIAASTTWADEVAEALRAKIASDGDAVIRVRFVGEETEYSWGFTQEIPATVIAPDGLAVASLMLTDPALLDAAIYGDEEEMELQISTKLSAMKYLMPDGSELEAQIVLRDLDLDLAFLRPETPPAAPMAYLDLTKAGSAQACDQVIFLQRLGKIAKRECTASSLRLSLVIGKPRTVYVASTDLLGGLLGCPAFSMEGAPLGIVLARWLRGQADDNLMSDYFDESDFCMTVILPGADVMEIAAQAPALAAEEPVKPPKKKPAKEKEGAATP